MAKLHRAPRGAQKKILQARELDDTSVHTADLVELLVYGLALGEADAISAMVDALRFEVAAAARFTEDRPELASVLDIWARRLRVISEVRTRELAGRAS